ncbi:hypothetical protein HOF78_00790 [Candidatus Woesearchaeota archaeon]|jgi:hypothetical protein|nr:hypothetical protein [Candidatus Woesearchaeota archaeon]MBT6045078.1 hypothetical protein [Candidatus Woesearchaeota archaeon]
MNYETLAELFSNFFKTHNVFQKTKQEIIDYLKNQKDELIFIENAATFLVKTGEGLDKNHTRWKFRHFAYLSQESALKLLEKAEAKVRNSSKTAKIELTIAENEDSFEFFKSNGYEQEGILKNHYRPNEDCYILSKYFSE